MLPQLFRDPARAEPTIARDPIHMCGIVGLVGAFGAQEGARLAERMNQTLIHRGPDDAGSWSTDGFAFAMRRLSIIDLAGGHQPMGAPDGVRVVFNGEIYNFKQLRSDLEGQGYRFATRSDTEVLLNLYHWGGLAALDRLEGMFAICLHDPRAGKIHLIRDRLGIKPLFYAHLGGRFYFASEIKAILAVLPQRPPIDPAALRHYLTLRFVPQPLTIWSGIFKLLPGHRLEWDLANGDYALHRYWSVDFDAADPAPERDYPGEFAERFLAAVEKRLVAADVPVGVLLSGGLDSSAISAAAVELGHRAFHTFSVGFDDPQAVDERPWARRVAEQLGARHHEVAVSRAAFVDGLPGLLAQTDEPLADLSAIPLHLLCREARQHVKVVLSGEGSDEALAGYDLERLAARLASLDRLSAWAPRPLIAALARLIPRFRPHLEALAAGGVADLPRTVPWHITKIWTEAEKAALLKGGGAHGSTIDLIRSWYDAAPGHTALDRIQQVYCGPWLADDLLAKADRASMAASLELRTPFLDHALVEWAATLPLSWRVGDARAGWSSKRILRDFCRGRLPEGIRARPKQGFPVPAYRWLRQELASWAEDRLLGSGSRLRQVMDCGRLAPVMAAARAGSTSAAHRVWTLIILDEWLGAWT